MSIFKSKIDHQGQLYYIIVHLWTKMLKNYLIYNFAILISGIPKSGTHSHIFKVPVMPKMDDIQSLLLELLRWAIRISYNIIFTEKVYDPDLSRMKLLFILKYLLKMPIQF